jgi:hypothetical protein
MDAFAYPWDMAPPPAAAPARPEVPPPKAKPRGRRPAALTRAAPLAPGPAPGTAPDWLYHRLTVSGPAETVARFAAAARGAGITPWQLDFAAIEEDVFARAVSQLAIRQNHLTVAGCRILARQFRERVEMRQARAAALVGQSLACPFDLHALLPVPAAILQLGPSDPTSLAWLSAHWGIGDRLRQVAVRPDATTGRRLRKTHAVIGYGFFTYGETPHAAITRVGERWPGLRFWLVPRPAD